MPVVSHDERNAKGSGNYYRFPGGAGGLVVLGQSSPAASVKTAAGIDAIATASRHTYLSLPMNSDAPASRGKMLALLRAGPFRRYIIGSLISDTGTWMQVMAQGWRHEHA